MKRHFVLAFGVVASLLAFPACSSDDDNDKGTVTTETITIDCGIETTPLSVQYTISGNTLVSVANGQRSEMTRVAAGSGDKAIYGTWGQTLPTGADAAFAAKYQVKNTATLRVEPGRVTAAVNCSNTLHAMSASVSTPATITDTTLEILEGHREHKRWSSRAGESTVSKTSVNSLAAEAPLEGAPLADVSSVATFPFAAP